MSERTPQDVLREVHTAIFANLTAERQKPVLMRSSGYESGLAYALRTIDAFDKAIAEAPDSPRCDFDCDACKEEPS